MIPNKYQKAVFDSLKSRNHKVVIARAGTGKTSTILEALTFLDPAEDVLLCAFNKSIQTELEQRAPKHVDVRTMHSIGFGCLRRGGKFTVDADKTKKIIRELLDDRGIRKVGRMSALGRLVGLAKNMMLDDTRNIEEVAYSHGIEDEDNPARELASQAAHVMRLCLEDTETIDFDDMIWIPTQHDMKPRSYRTVFVDEAQDLNACQLWMIDQLVRKNGRLIAVGDDRQSLYRFRGAGEDVIDGIVKDMSADVFPLKITYRCPKKVVEIARQIVPDYEAASTAPEGEVLTIGKDDVPAQAQPGDFILSRKNAPLMGVCLSLLAVGKPAQIAGRDVGKSLATLIKKFDVETIEELMIALGDYLASERRRLLPAHEEAYGIACDKEECIRALCEGETSVDAVIGKIERLFTDTDTKQHIVCSTVHRAKGLERKRVMILEDTFNVGKSTEEDNIFYVAVTRAQETLIFVR